MRLGGRGFDGQRVQVARLGQDGLAQRQRRSGLVPGIVVGAPQRRRAIELFEYRNDHPGRIIDRRRVTATVIGHQQLARFFSLCQKASQRAVRAVIEQPAKPQQHVLRANGTHGLLDPPQSLPAQTQRHRFIFLAVGRGPGAVEDAVTGRLDQRDAVVLAQFGQALDSSFLGRQASLADRLRLKPVEVVRKVDDGVRSGVIEQ